ncbi:MAG: hypothetical protein G01um101424_128 [Parcubacteria group bacterium Gr01-1014_24]|nr:MAG: hypothetical protein G01um101424_128 [Parcubacteria group bacterium Gr01-1014_24]
MSQQLTDEEQMARSGPIVGLVILVGIGLLLWGAWVAWTR